MELRYNRRSLLVTGCTMLAALAGYAGAESHEQDSGVPVEQPNDVPAYTIENTEDVSFLLTDRRVVNVTTGDDVEELTFEDFDAICHDVVYEITTDEDVNAIAIHFWRDGQIIGSESAYAVVDWAPEGNWEDAGDVETGEYDRHEFKYDPEIAIEVEDLSGPDTVRLGEEVTIEVMIHNHSPSTISHTIYVRERHDTI